YLQTPEVSAGMAGRVQYYASAHRNYMGPLLVLKLELEHRVVAQIEAQPQPQREEVLRALRTRGLREAIVSELADFMQTVDRLQTGAIGGETQVSARRFSELVSMGRRILAELDAAAVRHP
ncbi:MAG TPA: hypothetical protein VHZ95_09320, partial [Polyangiales bacterium]|nr:hypothetical protein [Polyangiales bacterium]